MGTRAFINEPSGHVRLRVVHAPVVDLYDQDGADTTPELWAMSLSLLVTHGERSHDRRIREAARVVRATARTQDWCNPFGMTRPS